MDTLANATSSDFTFTPVSVAVTSSLIDNVSGSYSKIIMGPMLAVAIYFLVDFFLPGWKLEDKLGNKIPSGPRGLPIVGMHAKTWTKSNNVVSLTDFIQARFHSLHITLS